MHHVPQFSGLSHLDQTINCNPLAFARVVKGSRGNRSTVMLGFKYGEIKPHLWRMPERSTDRGTAKGSMDDGRQGNPNKSPGFFMATFLNPFIPFTRLDFVQS